MKSGGVPQMVANYSGHPYCGNNRHCPLFCHQAHATREKNRGDFKQEILEEFQKNKQVVQVNVPKKDFGKVTGEPDGLQFVDNTKDTESGEVSLTYVGRLVIPKIQVVTPLAADVECVSLRFGAGISPDFSGINEPGLTAVFGHRFLTSGKDFNRLDEIVDGDQFYIDYAPTGKRYYYDVRASYHPSRRVTGKGLRALR